MSGLEVAAGWVVLAAAVGLGWVWLSERRRVRQFCALLDALEADLRQGRTARRLEERVRCACGEWGMKRGSGFRVDGIQHTAVGCWPLDGPQKEEER